MKNAGIALTAGAVAAFVLIPLVASSQASTPRPNVDAEFPTLAAQGNAAEIDMARLALQRGNALEVRGFAQKMIAEHGDLGERLARVAPASVAVRPRENPIDALALERLAGLPPADFDQEYLTQQIGDHLATISVFETEARDGHDPALKAFATNELPTIREHLELAVNDVKHIGGATPFYSH